MRTIKTVIAAALVIGSVACKNESVVVEPSCAELVAEAQGDLDLANARMSVLTTGRTGVTNQRNDILDQSQNEASEVVELELEDVDAEVAEFNEAIDSQNDVITDAKKALLLALVTCPSADQSGVEALQTELSLEEEVELTVEEQSAKEMIEEMAPLIVEAYEEIQELEAEKEELEAGKQVLEADTSAVSQDDIAEQLLVITSINQDISDVEAELLEARKRHAQYSAARRMAYYTLNTSVAAAEVQ